MAEELIRVPRTDAPARADTGTFPAGTAILLLTVSFVLTRVLLRFTITHHGAADAAVLSGVAGAVFGCAAIVRELFAAAMGPSGRSPLARVWTGLRALAILPVFALVISAMVGEPPAGLQWAAFGGVALTLVTSSLGGIVAGRGQWFARVALATFMVGELIELAWPAAAVTASPETFWPQLFNRLGAVPELCALIGSLAAAAWAFVSTQRSAGVSRTRAFAGLPLAGAAMISLRVALAQARPSVTIARILFGTRFDLVLDSEHLSAVSTGGVLLYLLVPELLLFASCVSAAALGQDRGAAGRRVAGWMAVLIAGFGTLRLAGPMDPIRMVTVSLAAVLLERAVSLEAEDRAAV